MARLSNTSGTEDSYIKDAENFASSLEDTARTTSEHFHLLIGIINSLDEKIDEAKRLLDENEISHDL